MGRRQFILIILVAFLGGIAGGVLSDRYISGPIAFARNETRLFRQEQIQAKTIIAEAYFLHEKNEKNGLAAEIQIPRALLTTGPNGEPKLIMQDKGGKPRFSIHVSDENGTTLALLDAKGNQKALLSEKSIYGENRSAPALTLLDNSSAVRAQLGLRTDGNPFLSLNDPLITRDKTGRSIDLKLTEKDKAGLFFYGAEGNHRAGLAVDMDHTTLFLKDLKGETRVELGDTELTFGKDGVLEKSAPEDFSVEKRPPSSLVLYDENGKVFWTAP